MLCTMHRAMHRALRVVCHGSVNATRGVAPPSPLTLAVVAHWHLAYSPVDYGAALGVLRFGQDRARLRLLYARRGRLRNRQRGACPPSSH